ncbi:O-antigen translocase [Psychrobacillus sp.]|uniref:O-antigen translocase n=1 Tax=Psychrobacillus sp. TaxID=1871623 RepID=UPI0028BDEE19|nr:O-antigen translocase [Psychrobacillus sp.]
MNFLKTSLLSAISTVIKLASGLVINKIIAVYIGPAGVALIGQFQNFLGIITTIGNGAINSGVTKYVAEYNEDDQKRTDVINAAFLITLFFSLILGGIVFLGSAYFSSWIFQTEKYSIIFKILGITLIFSGLNTVLLSIINGMKKIKLFIAINISSSLLSLLITSILTIKYQVFGALLAMVFVQAFILFITLPIAVKKLNINIRFNKIVDKMYFRKLFAFSLMAIVSVIAVSFTQILIRNHLILMFSIEQAGYWQSVWMISTMYLMVLTTAFSTYYLPKLSELKKKEELRREILSGYKIIIPFVVITASGIYFLRDFIILVLFTPDFYEMRSLFLFQLIGDFFKMLSWTLSFLMIAKAMTKTFIVTEIAFSLSFYVLTIWLTQINGLIGVTQAYALSYLIYLVTMSTVFKDILSSPKK